MRKRYISCTKVWKPNMNNFQMMSQYHSRDSPCPHPPLLSRKPFSLLGLEPDQFNLEILKFWNTTWFRMFWCSTWLPSHAAALLAGSPFGRESISFHVNTIFHANALKYFKEWSQFTAQSVTWFLNLSCTGIKGWYSLLGDIKRDWNINLVN